MTLARMRAKKAVLLALRAQGLKPQHFSAREIAVLTDYYLNQHRAQLMVEAAEVIATWPGFDRWRCAEMTSDAQRENESRSITYSQSSAHKFVPRRIAIISSNGTFHCLAVVFHFSIRNVRCASCKERIAYRPNLRTS
jgi:hypothetical protein